jgi:hypothetical protein
VHTFGFHKGDEKFMACSSSQSGVDPVIVLYVSVFSKIFARKTQRRRKLGRRRR